MKDNPRNPRKISTAELSALLESLRKFGDLSGIVFNVRSGKMVCGHQRLKVLEKEKGKQELSITRRYEQPTKCGTVAEGRLRVGPNDFLYREVDWPDDVEALAMISANQQGGTWDDPKLALLLSDLRQVGFKLSAIGITSETEQRLAELLAAFKEKDTTESKPAPQIKMVQCFVSVEKHLGVMRKIGILRKYYGAKDVTETVIRALELEAK